MPNPLDALVKGLAHPGPLKLKSGRSGRRIVEDEVSTRTASFMERLRQETTGQLGDRWTVLMMS
jgi:hypothetical protein